jgi:hypothetical protein
MLERAHLQLRDRSEVVVHEAAVGAGLLGERAGRDPRGTDADEEGLRGVERLLGLLSG